MSDKIYAVPAEWKSRALVDEAKYKAMYAQSVQDPDALGAQTVVVEGQAFDRALAAQHQIRERARDELAVGLEQDDLDRRIGQTDVLRRGGAAPAAADHHHTAARLLREVRHLRRAARGQEPEPCPGGRPKEFSPRRRVHPFLR